MGPEGNSPQVANDEQPLTSGDGGVAGCPTDKVLICHLPPGNPENAHTLCVGSPAVDAHLKHHGDNLGECGVSIGTPPYEAPDAGPPWMPEQVLEPAVACASEGWECGAAMGCCLDLQCVQGVCLPYYP